MKIVIVFILLFFVSNCSCKKEEVVYSKTQMIEWAKKVEPTADFKLGESITDIIPCADYGRGCLSVHRIEVRKIVMVAVEFSSYDYAHQAAKRLYAYQYNNWVLDDVVGEPFLENFVKKAFNAKLVGNPPPEPTKKPLNSGD